MVSSIGDLEDGAPARVEGSVRLAAGTTAAPLSGRAVVYWDVRRGLDITPERHGLVPFWLEDATGRILIPDESLEVGVRARRARDVLETISRDISVVSDQIRSIKRRIKNGQGGRGLRDEQARLARTATFLCAVRAQARGRTHFAKMTLSEQAAWIEAQADAHREEGGATVRVAVDRYEVVIVEGDPLIAEGVVAVEPMPPEMGGPGGYRDQPTCRVLRPGPDGVVRILGVGRAAPQTRRDGTDLSPSLTRSLFAVVFPTAAVVLLALIAWWWRS